MIAYGFGPELIPDLKGLMGDAPTTSRAFRAFGEKRPPILEFGPVEASSLPPTASAGARAQCLLEHADAARESKELATIDTNAPPTSTSTRCALRRDDSQLRFPREAGLRGPHHQAQAAQAAV